MRLHVLLIVLEQFGMGLCQGANDLQGRLARAVFEFFVFHDFRADEEQLLSARLPDLSEQVCEFNERLKGLLALFLVGLNHLHNDVKKVRHVGSVLQHLVLVLEH